MNELTFSVVELLVNNEGSSLKLAGETMDAESPYAQIELCLSKEAAKRWDTMNEAQQKALCADLTNVLAGRLVAFDQAICEGAKG